MRLFVTNAGLSEVNANKDASLSIYSCATVVDGPPPEMTTRLLSTGAPDVRLRLLGRDAACMVSESASEVLIVTWARPGAAKAAPHLVGREVAVWQPKKGILEGSDEVVGVSYGSYSLLSFVDEAFFVNAESEGRKAHLLGPFHDHLQALLRVSDVRMAAMASTPSAASWTFSTCSLPWSAAVRVATPAFNGRLGIAESELQRRSDIEQYLQRTAASQRLSGPRLN